MTQRTTKPLAGIVLAGALATAAPALAQEDWEYTGFIYLWGAGIGGETVTGQDVDVSFSDVVDNLDFGIMGTLEARKGPWSVLGDAIYLNIAKGDNAAVGPGIPASADADIQGLVLSGALGYDLIDTNQYRLNGFGGLRYLSMDTTVNVGVGNNSRRLNDNIDNLDAVVGIRGIYSLSDQWDVIYYGDIGTGDTDFTWQAAVAVDYNFDNWALSVGYRHLAWEDLNNSNTLTDIEFSGPFVGAKFNF